ncbi:helix-turn-helix domain-containing protein [Sulfuricurvum sp.]|uniref:helix-turn-helix domain-containing protein n=1 Tax=Sulfuricurvum sp. TaxID=2025608 RepID=UPI0035683E40
MSFKIIGAAFDLPLLGNDKLVFLALCENADDSTRTCCPSYSTIQKKASLANSSLKTALQVLEAVGLISIKIRSTKGGGRTSTLYKIHEFDVEKFDVKNYKKIARKIRAIRNFRKKKDIQSPTIDTVEKYPNLRKSVELEESLQPPKIDTILDHQPPKSGEEPLASSFQPLVLREEEEEACAGEMVPATTIPLQLHGLTENDILDAVKELVRRKRPNDPSRYEARLFVQIETGDHRTCENVLKIIAEQQASTREKPWEREKRLKREHGEAMHLVLQNCGFNNPGEAYATMKNRDGIDDVF